MLGYSSPQHGWFYILSDFGWFKTICHRSLALSGGTIPANCVISLCEHYLAWKRMRVRLGRRISLRPFLFELPSGLSNAREAVCYLMDQYFPGGNIWSRALTYVDTMCASLHKNRKKYVRIYLWKKISTDPIGKNNSRDLCVAPSVAATTGYTSKRRDASLV